MIIQWRADKYPPLGRWVYCGETNPKELTKEHIIPFTLLPKGGDWFLRKASCKACARITKQFEGQVCGGMFGPLKEQLDLKTRNRGAHQKKTGRMQLRKNSRDGKIWDEEILVSSFPTLCMGFQWPVPGILLDDMPTTEFKGDLFVRCSSEQVKQYATEVEAFRIGRVGPLNCENAC